MLPDAFECNRYKEYTENRRVGYVAHDVYPGYVVQTFRDQNAAATDAAEYRLIDTEYSSYFSVLRNGQLMTVTKLTPLINKQIKLIVVEERPNGNVTHVLRLHVIRGDKVLRFSRPVYEGGTILENQPAFTRVIGLPDIYVIGEGVHSNGGGGGGDVGPMIKHRIVDGNDDDGFALKLTSTELSQNGSYVHSFKLLSKKTFDRERKKSYALIIQVTDAKGVDKASARVYIKVLDENDNNPVFKQPIYEFYVGNFQR